MAEQELARAKYELNINKKVYQVEVDPSMPLLWVLRDELGLAGTKFGCGKGLCGACTIHLNGAAVRSCVLPVSGAAGAQITTIEGLAEAGATSEQPATMTPVQREWIAGDVPQCGYCQSGQIMAAAALLKQKKKVSDADIDQAMSNVCRCGTYNRIRAAIKRAAKA